MGAVTARPVPAPLVIVLGASGTIGSALGAELVGGRRRVRLVARRCPVPPPGFDGAMIEVRSADVTVRDDLDDVVTGADAVMQLVAHLPAGRSWRLAADDPDGWRVNLGVVEDLVDVVRAGGPRTPAPVVVLAGSIVQGTAPFDPGTGADVPLTPYARQKTAAERVVWSATAAGHVRGISLRLPTVYGGSPGGAAGDRGVVATMVRRALAGDPLPLWHDGSVTRDLLSSRDAAAAFAAALDHADALAGRPWAVGTGEGRALGDVFGLIARLVSDRTGDPPVPILRIDPPPTAVPADLSGVVVDPSAFRSVTGWRPRVGLEDGMAEIVDQLTAAKERVQA